MEGTAASNSMAVPKGRLSHVGDSSVRNNAIPKLTGTAITKAINRSGQGAVDHDQPTEVFLDRIPGGTGQKARVPYVAMADPRHRW